MSILCLSLGILVASCGIKIALTHSLNIENYCGQSLKSVSSCSFAALENKQEKFSIQQKKSEDLSFDFNSKIHFQEHQQFENSNVDFPFSRSIPLYILYQQQRDALFS
ncbi:hypothetical protein [Soonwooa sp.]|uniref:hypothetical protein n=1 Tax=Soonwooa sp. TaxID=1938592 RepID=UPI0035B2F593